MDDEETIDAVERTARLEERARIRRYARMETLSALCGSDADEDFCDAVEEMIESWKQGQKAG